jgi:hypothetical protein
MVEKCTTGCLISTVLLLLLVGPFFFFSTIGGMATLNPVSQAELNVHFLFNKTVFSNTTNDGRLLDGTSYNDSVRYIEQFMNNDKEDDIHLISQTVPYHLYK